jgi:acyl carrier protein
MNEDTRQSPSLSRSSIEFQLFAIWREMLEIDIQNANASFRSLGGDSLAAMRCISRIRTAFGIEFDLIDFMADDATISFFSTSIESYSQLGNHIGHRD